MRLSRAREEEVVALLLTGRSVPEICEAMRLSRSTLWRLRARPEFEAKLKAARHEALQGVVNKLHDSALVFAEALRGVCEDPKARGSERATAGRAGLDSLFRARELYDVEERLKALEKLAGDRR
jgi:hypothetical protein